MSDRLRFDGGTVTLTRYDNCGESWDFTVKRAPHGRVWCPNCGTSTKPQRLELRSGLFVGLVCIESHGCGLGRSWESLDQIDTNPLG